MAFRLIPLRISWQVSLGWNLEDIISAALVFHCKLMTICLCHEVGGLQSGSDHTCILSWRFYRFLIFDIVLLSYDNSSSFVTMRILYSNMNTDMDYGWDFILQEVEIEDWSSSWHICNLLSTWFSLLFGALRLIE